MRKNVLVRPVGNVNRRSLVTQGSSTEVLHRINLAVIGSKEEDRFIKKVPGADRYNTDVVSSYPAVSPFRYYGSGQIRKNFFFSGGKVWFIDELGNCTETLGFFNVNAYPVFLEAQVSSNRVVYFSEGFNTGMYSHDGNISNTWQKETAVQLNLVDAVMFLDRMVGFEEDSEDLYLSKNLEPTNFTDSTDAVVITVGAKRGSKLQKVMVGQDDNLYIWKSDSTWVLEGKTPAEFRVREIDPSIGLAARRSLQKVNNGFIGLMSDYELHSFDGANFKLLTYNVALSGDQTKDLLPILNRDRMDQIASCFHNYLYRMSFVEDGQTINDMEICFSTINETEFFTRGFKIASYLVYNRVPDKNEMKFGRSDTGRMMHAYRGLNPDNQATNATMQVYLKTKFNGIGEARNFRVRKVWLNCGVLGARPVNVRTYVDARNALSDASSSSMTTFGEYKSPISSMKFASQDAVTSRNIPRHNKAIGQSVAFEINDQIPDFDFQFMSFEASIIPKHAKRNEKVGI